MPEFLANFSTQITEYWGRFTRRQKIQIIAIFAAAVAALVVLTFVLSRPNYVLYQESLDPSVVNTMRQTLTDNNINSRVGDDATSLYVDSASYTEARLALATAGMLTTGGYSYADAFNSSFNTTSDERDLKQQLAFESEINDTLQMISVIETAKVKFVIPDDRLYIFEEDQEASASVMLTLNGRLDDQQAQDIAGLLQSLVPNLSLSRIKIMNSETSKLLYNGTEAGMEIGGITAYMEVEAKYEKDYEQRLQMLLLSGTEFDDATIVANLDFDFDQVSIEAENFSRPAGQDGDLPKEVYLYSSTGTNTAAGGRPGTDANDSTTYVVDNGSSSDSTVEITDQNNAIDRTVTRTVKAIGRVQPATSTISVVLNRHKYYDEATLEADGTLAGTTWKQYQIDNGGNKLIEAAQYAHINGIVANAAQINDVNIIAYEVPVFVPKTAGDNQVAEYIPVIIIVMMIALLGYAIYRGTEPTEVTEVEPELSVEEMLATTNKVSDELEAIEMNDKSEARVQIEKFVDENPEAVAQLLRNWLNEDWE